MQTHLHVKKSTLLQTNRFDPNLRVSQAVLHGDLEVPKRSLYRKEPDTMFFMLKQNLKCIWKVCCHRNHFAEIVGEAKCRGREAFNEREKLLNTTAYEKILNF